MFYVERNQNGEIVTLRREADKPGMEGKQSIDDEILEFLGSKEQSDHLHQILASSDVAVMRILEDLVDLLIKKNLIMFTELPVDAQIKLQDRRQMRQKIRKETLMVEDII